MRKRSQSYTSYQICSKETHQWKYETFLHHLSLYDIALHGCYKLQGFLQSSFEPLLHLKTPQVLFNAKNVLEDLKEKWDAFENKSTVLLYGGGAIVVVWICSIVVSAVNSVPQLPKIMELVGLGYTGWFVYHYLLFKESRKELASDIEALK